MGRKTMSGNTAVIKIMDCVRNFRTLFVSLQKIN